MSGISLLVLMLLLSVAIDRVVKAILFLLSYTGLWQRLVPDPRLIEDPVENARAEKRQKLVYTTIVAISATVLVAFYPDIRIVRNLVDEKTNEILDMIVSIIVLIGGSDILGRLLQISGIGEIGTGGSSANSEPLQITGKLVLENTGKNSEK